MVLDLPGHLASHGNQQQDPPQPPPKSNVDGEADDLGTSDARGTSGTRAATLEFTEEGRGLAVEAREAGAGACTNENGALEENGVTPPCNADATHGDASTLAYRCAPFVFSGSLVDLSVVYQIIGRSCKDVRAPVAFVM